MRRCSVILLAAILWGCGAETCPEVVCEDIVYVGLEPPIEGTYQVELMTEAGTFSFSCSEGVVDGDGAVACDQDGFQLPGRPERVELRVQAGVWGAEHRFNELLYHEVRAGGAECPSLCVHAELNLVMQ
ncbi:MAG TPA: hypothetical protein DEB46_12280 [Myxococcales bacterium]|nr:hypothetical protein [Myxococcales bacterium]HBU49077.1 hypothetical protein [Myxococcales bacterium]